jgi:hypothetical protein
MLSPRARVRTSTRSLSLAAIGSAACAMPACTYDFDTSAFKIDAAALTKVILEYAMRGEETSLPRDQARMNAAQLMNNNAVDSPDNVVAWATPKKSEVNFYSCSGEAVWCSTFFTNLRFERSVIEDQSQSWVAARLQAEHSDRWDGTSYIVSLPELQNEAFVMLYCNRTKNEVGWIAVQPSGENIVAMMNNGQRSVIGPHGSQAFTWQAAPGDCRITITVANVAAVGGERWVRYSFD